MTNELLCERFRAMNFLARNSHLPYYQAVYC
jgi:hypothetical protein